MFCHNRRRPRPHHEPSTEVMMKAAQLKMLVRFGAERAKEMGYDSEQFTTPAQDELNLLIDQYAVADGDVRDWDQGNGTIYSAPDAASVVDRVVNELFESDELELVQGGDPMRIAVLKDRVAQMAGTIAEYVPDTAVARELLRNIRNNLSDIEDAIGDLSQESE